MAQHMPDLGQGAAGLKPLATVWRSRWEPIGGMPARTHAGRTTPETARSDTPWWGARTRRRPLRWHIPADQ